MSRLPAVKDVDENTNSDGSTHASEQEEGVLELNPGPPGAPDAGSGVEDLTPNQQKAFEIIKDLFGRKAEYDDEAQRQKLKEESFLIKQAATSITGLSLLSGFDDQRVIVAYRMRDFFAAIPMPPESDSEQRRAIRHEALTMFLKLSPQDDIERMLISQMIASHVASMECFKRAASHPTVHELSRNPLNMAHKMSRLFIELEKSLLNRRKRKGYSNQLEPMIEPREMALTMIEFFEDFGINFDEDHAPT